MAVDPGFFHLAAAQLAVEHFNSRNATVVPELQSMYRDCPYTFAPELLQAVDTGTDQHYAMESIVQDLVRSKLQQNASTSVSGRPPMILPDAIAGPYNELPTLELSVLATGLQIPLVAARVLNPNLLQNKQHPYFHQVGPDPHSAMGFVATYLRHIGRTNYIAILYPASSASGGTEDDGGAASSSVVVRKAGILRDILEEQGWEQVQSFGYTPEAQPAVITPRENDIDMDGNVKNRRRQTSNDIRTVLQQVKATGYRTIVYLPTSFTDLVATTEVTKAATELELDQAKHLWIISSGAEQPNARNIDTVLSYLSTYNNNNHDGDGDDDENIQQNNTVNRHTFFNGGAYLYPYDGYELDYQRNFRKVLLESYTEQMFEQGLGLVRKVSTLNNDTGQFEIVAHPWEEELREIVLSGNTGKPLLNFAQYYGSWLYGASFMYDAVLSIGMGACAAMNHQNNTAMTGAMHRSGIRSVDFRGASGRIQFGPYNDTITKRRHQGYPGSRVASTVPFVVINGVLDKSSDSRGRLTVRPVETMDPATGKWLSWNPLIYADGTTLSPSLRQQPDQNYISDGIKILCICLFGVSLLIVLASLIWVFLNRNHSVIIAGQPVFLFALCFASILMCFLILISAFDESWGFSQEALDASCCTWTWFDGLGRTITYSALFTKVRFFFFSIQRAASAFVSIT